MLLCGGGGDGVFSVIPTLISWAGLQVPAGQSPCGLHPPSHSFPDPTILGDILVSSQFISINPRQLGIPAIFDSSVQCL